MTCGIKEGAGWLEQAEKEVVRGGKFWEMIWDMLEWNCQAQQLYFMGNTNAVRCSALRGKTQTKALDGHELHHKK